MVIERFIYRRNSPEWREQIFGVKEFRRPQTFQEINEAIEKRLEKDEDAHNILYLS